MGKLSFIKAQLDGKTSDEVLIEKLFNSLFESVHKNSAVMSGGIQTKLNELQRVVGAFGADVNKNSNASLEKIIKGLNEVVATLTKGQNAADRVLIQRLNELEKSVNKKPPDVKGLLGDAVGRIEKGINAIPKTDLSPIEEAILELSKIDIPQTDLEPLTKLLERPKEWEFEFVYKKRGGGIDKVLATEVT